MSQVQDSQIFSSILSTPASAAIFSDSQRTAYYLLFEAGLARAQAQLNILPQRAADEIVKYCDVSIIDWRLLKEKTEVIGYPVLGVVQQLVGKVNEAVPGEELGEWAHWGATTQDVTDTATILQLRDTLSLLSTSLNAIILVLRGLCLKHKSTPMPARSNLQQAVPISYGFKLARLLAAFLRHRERLDSLRPRLLVLQFSGAAGTLATLPPTDERPELGLDCQNLLAKELGLRVPEISWHTDRDLIAEFSSFLSLLTSTCAKFALDLKLQMQTEVAEVSEPYVKHRGSSSTMPQKRNPVGCVYITAMNATIRQLSASLMEGVAGQDHERSTGAWEVEWIVLPQICTLGHGCLEHTRKLVEGLEVNERGMRRNLDISKGAIVSEAVMMGLGRAGMGRQKAHDVCYDLCRTAGLENRDLADVLVESEEVKQLGVSKEELEGWCDPANYLGYSEVMVERVLRMCEDRDPS